MLGKNGTDESKGRYIAFNQIISYLKDFPIWVFFLSTKSRVGELIPPNNTKRKRRHPFACLAIHSSVPLKQFPPFLSLQLDIEDRRRMQNSGLMLAEITKPLSEFSKSEHMALFGRPLWGAYVKPHEMYSLEVC